MSFDLTKTNVFAVTDPKLITVDLEQVQKRTNEANLKRDEANQPKSDPQKELDKLIQTHFDLKQNTRHAENLLNEACGQQHLCEQRVKQAKTLLKNCESPLGQRHYEAAVRRLESIELIDCLNNVKRLRKNNAETVSVLRSWEAEFLPRIEQLRKEVKK
jgi:hypothetical protein